MTKRYGVIGKGRMAEFESGDYVSYEDYLALYENLMTDKKVSDSEDMTLRNAMHHEENAKLLGRELEVVNARLAERTGEVQVAQAAIRRIAPAFKTFLGSVPKAVVERDGEVWMWKQEDTNNPDAPGIDIKDIKAVLAVLEEK